MNSQEQSNKALMHACAEAALLFTRMGEDGFTAASERRAWEGMAACAGVVIEAPSADARHAVESELLVPGLPLAAMPVESLYKPWRAPDGTVRASRGLYGGETAGHAQALFDACGLEIPQEFSAMPDHLSLLLELLALFLEVGNDQAAGNLIRDHFDWLGEYDAALRDRAERAADAPAFDEAKRRALAEGIAFLRTLTMAVDKAVHARLA